LDKIPEASDLYDDARIQAALILRKIGKPDEAVAVIKDA